MKKLFSVWPVAAIAFLSLQTVNDPLPIGSSLPNPDAKMKDISGKEVSFKDAMKKNGLLVMFSCNTCPVVGKYQSRTLETGKYAAEKGVGVILLNSNEATRSDGESFDDMKEYGKGQGYPFSYVLDNNSVMADAFGATRTPEVFLFDKSGKLVYHGAIDDNSNDPGEVTRKHAAIAIDEMVAGKAVSTTKTRFVGCGIKRL
ncbi:MAG TPA: thioredoxin family protein [Chitinophagaceae bacterium]|nr:thioredoxin family protein [Chitinophagaceae bacterium]